MIPGRGASNTPAPVTPPPVLPAGPPVRYPGLLKASTQENYQLRLAIVETLAAQSQSAAMLQELRAIRALLERQNTQRAPAPAAPPEDQGEGRGYSRGKWRRPGRSRAAFLLQRSAYR
jgi:hypothetical protein